MKAPDKIYLTNGDPEHLINFDSDAANGLVMWCEDKITDHDIEYIRKDALLEWAEGKIKHYMDRQEYDCGWNDMLDELIDKINSL